MNSKNDLLKMEILVFSLVALVVGYDIYCLVVGDAKHGLWVYPFGLTGFGLIIDYWRRHEKRQAIAERNAAQQGGLSLVKSDDNGSPDRP